MAQPSPAARSAPAWLSRSHLSDSRTNCIATVKTTNLGLCSGYNTSTDRWNLRFPLWLLGSGLRFYARFRHGIIRGQTGRSPNFQKPGCVPSVPEFFPGNVPSVPGFLAKNYLRFGSARLAFSSLFLRKSSRVTEIKTPRIALTLPISSARPVHESLK